MRSGIRDGPGTRARALPRLLLILALAALALGVFFRFYHLDRKVYWGDEVYSSLRIYGDTEADLVRRAPSFENARALWTVLHPTPSGGSADPFAPTRSLAVEEPHHTPVYYELAHFWVSAFGNSIAATRSLSAWLSLLALPCAFWLALELFGSRRAAWMAAALVALSPVVVLLAQQAREYALWTAALLALQAGFLRAVRRDSAGAWTLFAVLSAFALYVHLLTAFVLGGLALYALIVLRGRRGSLLRCALASGAAFVAIVPWLVFLLRDLGPVTDSLATTFHVAISRADVLRDLARAVRANFLDLWITPSAAAAAGTAAVAVLVAATLVNLCLRQPPRTRLFIGIMLLATTLPFLLPDFVSGGQRLRNDRYLIPAYLALDLALLAWLQSLVESPRRPLVAWGYGLFGAVLISGAVSCAHSSQTVTWWSTDEDNSVAVARAVNAAREPLVTGDGFLVYPLVLSNYLNGDVRMALWPACYECRNAAPERPDPRVLAGRTFATLFTLGSSANLQRLAGELVRSRPGAAYTCINVRRNCTSALNVEPVFAPR